MFQRRVQIPQLSPSPNYHTYLLEYYSYTWISENYAIVIYFNIVLKMTQLHTLNVLIHLLLFFMLVSQLPYWFKMSNVFRRMVGI